MEASVVRNAHPMAFGTPHCQVCLVFLGQPVPVVSTARGYRLFCEVCELGRGAITVRARDAHRMDIRVDPPPAADPSEEE